MNRIARIQIVLNTLYDQLDQIAVGVDQHRDKQITLSKKKEVVFLETSLPIAIQNPRTYNLFFRIFVRRQQVDRFHVPEINVMTQQEYEEQFANVFLLLISIEGLIAFELAPNVRQLFVYPLDFGFFALA